MDRIVIELGKISFQQDSKNIYSENCSPNINNSQCQSELQPFIQICAPNTNAFYRSLMAEKSVVPFTLEAESNATDDEDDSGSENDELDSVSKNDSKCLPQVRCMPQRASKQNFLNSQNLRIPMKAKKTNSGALSESKIKKMYLVQKLTNFHPAKLETIFEEPQLIKSKSASNQTPHSDQFRFLGARKLRRSLTISNGLNINKTLLKQRRAKVKKNFGRRPTGKKMLLNSFKAHLNGTFNAIDNENGNNSGEEKEESCSLMSTLTEAMEEVNNVEEIEMENSNIL